MNLDYLNILRRMPNIPVRRGCQSKSTMHNISTKAEVNYNKLREETKSYINWK